MPRSASPRKKHQRRLINIPVMPELALDFERQLRSSLMMLRATPVIEAFDGVAEIIDVIGITLNRLKRADLHNAFRLIQSGASAMIQIKGKYERTGKVQMSELEYFPIVNAVNECIEVLPRLGVTNLYLSMQELKGMK